MRFSPHAFRTVGSIALLVAVASSFANQADSPASKAFEKLKSLVGTWTGKAGTANVTVTYRLTGAGSSLVETLFPGQPHEMVTIYHLDGSDLLLTHYCAAGNQPTLRLKPGKSDRTFEFDFVRGTNMKPDSMHMHNLVLTFKGENEISSKWTSFAGGKAAGIVEFNMKRSGSN